MGPNKKSSRFPDTQWSLVGRAEAGDDVLRQEALAALLAIYTPGLKEFLTTARFVPCDLVDDLVHGFIADKILSRKLLHHADQGKGKFRNFLLKALNNYVTTKLKREYAERAMACGIDLSEIANCAPDEGMEKFDQVWVQQIVQDAISLMNADCVERGRMDLWELFSCRVVDPMLHGTEPLDYEGVVTQFQLQTPRQAINLLATAKRCFVRHLRVAVGRYVQGEDRIDAEIADLQGIVCR